MVVDRPEVEARAVPREVAGVGHGMSTVAPRHREAHLEGIEGEGGVDVEITEQDLLRARHADILRCLAHAAGSLLYDGRTDCGTLSLPSPRRLDESARPRDVEESDSRDEQDPQEDGDEAKHGVPPEPVLLPLREYDWKCSSLCTGVWAGVGTLAEPGGRPPPHPCANSGRGPFG
jgi:hypothetical protein